MVKVNLDIQDIRHPVYFDGKNVCTHCGAENSLAFVDKFGREAKTEVHAFDHIKCKECGQSYSILWKPSKESSTKMYPSAIDHTIKKEFTNIIMNNFDKMFNRDAQREKKLEEV